MFLSRFTHDLNSGFDIDHTSAADSRADLRAIMICVDFPNHKAEDCENSEERTVDYYYDLLIRSGLDVFSSISYGKLRLTVDKCEKWFTMAEDDTYYGMERVITFETHSSYISAALDASEDYIDYSKYDILYIVPVKGSAVPYSPTMINKSYPIASKSGKAKMGLVVTFGADMYFRKGKLFAHENGHIMGLPDLYTYETAENEKDCFAHCGGYDLMGSIEAIAPDYLAYSKWRLGWLDDTNIKIFRESGKTVLSPVEAKPNADDIVLAVVPIDDYNGYCIEYRTPSALDSSLPYDGIIVYRINGEKENGMGCITIIPKEKEKYLALSTREPDGLLTVGDTLTLPEGITVKVVGKGEIEVIR